MKRLGIIAAIGIAISANAEITKIRLPTPEHLDRADLYIIKPKTAPRAILILCPGLNVDGRSLVECPKWQKFAEQNELALCGLSFASPLKDIEKGIGYLHPSYGAGEALITGLKKTFGKDYPLLLLGFSGGAQFTARFVEWKPERVIAWCAYSAGSWGEPKPVVEGPPGIVACGNDDLRYGACLEYFLKGRAAGRRWAWVSLSDTSHHWSEPLNDFVRNYFHHILNSGDPVAQWRDSDLKTPLTEQDVAIHPTIACWLPSVEVAKRWTEIHQP